MAFRAALFLVMCGMLFGGPKSGGTDKAKCLATCKSSCNKSFATCKQNAKSKTAIESCQKSLDICNSNCVNKACSN